MKITKEDIKTYLKYGPMEFDLKKAMVLYFLIDFPINGIICFLYIFIRRFI